MTVEFPCKHRFCRPCAREVVKQKLRVGDFDEIKCFEHLCEMTIPIQTISDLFKNIDPHVYLKYRALRDLRCQERDPLVRFCPNQYCRLQLRADNLNVRKLTCPDCQESICFRCREEWHGYDTSCESNLQNKLERWAVDRGDVSFCPVCQTKIQKDGGCNHITCPFCRYEFCWLC